MAHDLPVGPGAVIDRGVLRLADLHNHPVWLNRELPDAVRVEFDAWAETDEGDIKVELAGDGVSFAKTASYTATGYVFIFGGWNNSLNVIARLDEHGDDRVAAPAEPPLPMVMAEATSLTGATRPRSRPPLW